MRFSADSSARCAQLAHHRRARRFTPRSAQAASRNAPSLRRTARRNGSRPASVGAGTPGCGADETRPIARRQLRCAGNWPCRTRRAAARGAAMPPARIMLRRHPRVGVVASTRHPPHHPKAEGVRGAQFSAAPAAHRGLQRSMKRAARTACSKATSGRQKSRPRAVARVASQLPCGNQRLPRQAPQQSDGLTAATSAETMARTRLEACAERSVWIRAGTVATAAAMR